jgi:hypothetical protein
MENSEDLVPPFIRNDQGDMWAFDHLSSHGIESFDAEVTEVFDSQGRRLRPIINGFDVQYVADLLAAPQPDRLFELLRQFFQRMTKKRDQGYRIAAESCQNLADLVALLVRWGNRT